MAARLWHCWQDLTGSVVPMIPQGWGLFPALTLGLCLVRGRGHGVRVSTVSCATARVDSHI